MGLICFNPQRIKRNQTHFPNTPFEIFENKFHIIYDYRISWNYPIEYGIRANSVYAGGVEYRRHQHIRFEIIMLVVH